MQKLNTLTKSESSHARKENALFNEEVNILIIELICQSIAKFRPTGSSNETRIQSKWGVESKNFPVFQKETLQTVRRFYANTPVATWIMRSDRGRLLDELREQECPWFPWMKCKTCIWVLCDLKMKKWPGIFYRLMKSHQRNKQVLEG